MLCRPHNEDRQGPCDVFFAAVVLKGLCGYHPGMTDTLPDRLCASPNSPYYDADLLERGVGVRFNGADKTNVEEYCVSEGWVRLSVGKAVDRKGNPMTVKLQGTVEPYWREAEG